MREHRPDAADTRLDSAWQATRRVAGSTRHGLSHSSAARLRTVHMTSGRVRQGVVVLRAMRIAGARRTMRRLTRRLRGSGYVYVGLTSDLSAPLVKRSKLAIEMHPVDPASFTGFRDEVGEASPRDALEAFSRQQMCDAGVETLYVAIAGDGRPIYAQWCITPSAQAALARLCPGRYPPLHDGEVLLEGAYTFTAFRGMRAMADGMIQLLRCARQAGARTALTYVNIDNVPSLRGCAACGFQADHIRIDHWRFGRRHSTFAPLRRATADRFARATAPREPIADAHRQVAG
jgi:hypothetical protein